MQFAENVADVPLDGTQADDEFLGNHAIVMALGDQSKGLLRHGQRGESLRRARPP
jgi:hypothetical protein